MTDFADIIARLEKAAGPDRELDIAIYRAEYPFPCVALPHATQDEYDRERGPRYTASLDAALTLVPEGMSAQIHVGPYNSISEADVIEPLRSTDKKGRRITQWRRHECPSGKDGVITPRPAAIALCIAALKARAALASGKTGDGSR